MKNNWEEKTLEEICDIYTGNSINETVKKKKYTNLTKGYNYIATKDISIDSNVNYNNGIKIPFDEEKFKVCHKGSILLCIERANAGNKIAFINQDVCFVNKLCSFRTIYKNLNSKFLFYYLQSPIFKDIFFDKKKGLIGGVSVGKIKKIKIKLPPLQEQKQIVEKLDKAFENIDKLTAIAKQNLENSKELFNSCLNKVFTQKNNNWEEKTLKDVCEIQPNKELIKHLKMNMLVSFVPMNDLGINSKYFKVNETKKLGEVIKQYTFFADNDVLLAKITPCFENGKLGIAKNLSNKIGFGSSEYIVFRTKEHINNEFLYYFLLQDKFKKDGIQNMYGAVGHKRVSINFIYNYKIKLPQLRQQKQIVKILDNLQEKTKKLEEIYNKKLELAKELKQSILHKALSNN